jgi:hypothetical protein
MKNWKQHNPKHLKEISDPQEMFTVSIYLLVHNLFLTFLFIFMIIRTWPKKYPSSQILLQNSNAHCELRPVILSFCFFLLLFSGIFSYVSFILLVCSGTEAPILALDMICTAVKELYDQTIEFEHVFSCEIEPYKQVSPFYSSFAHINCFLKFLLLRRI